MVARRWCAVVVTVCLGFAPAVVQGVAAADQPPSDPNAVVEVHVDSQAYQTERGTMTGSFRARCTPGHQMTEVAVTFAQGADTGPPSPAQPIACNGFWQRQWVSSPEHLFEGGPAEISVRAVVVDVGTGTSQELTVTKAVYVRPAAKIVLPATAELRPGNLVRMVVQARCDAPWVLQDFLVSGTQAAGAAYGSALLDLPCDGVTRPVTVWLTSDGVRFKRGALQVDAEITLLDPDFFDPAAQIRASRSVSVR